MLKKESDHLQFKAGTRKVKKAEAGDHCTSMHYYKQYVVQYHLARPENSHVQMAIRSSQAHRMHTLQIKNDNPGGPLMKPHRGGGRLQETGFFRS